MQERVKPSKKKLTVQVDTALAAAAAAEGIDLTALVEEALRAKLGSTVAGGLTAEERADHEWSKRYVAEYGPWWDDTEKS